MNAYTYIHACIFSLPICAIKPSMRIVNDAGFDEMQALDLSITRTFSPTSPHSSAPDRPA